MRMKLLALALAATAAMTSLPATAEEARGRIEADAFGNLIIIGASGYKRILVGQAGAIENRQPDLLLRVPAGPHVIGYHTQQERPASVRCWRPPHIWKGRSYMYGLPDGVIPQAPLYCGPER